MRGFLQGLVTNDVTGDLPVWAGLLTPQGKCLFDFIVWNDGDDLLLDCEAQAADDLIKRLGVYRLRRPIAIGSTVCCGIAACPPLPRMISPSGKGQSASKAMSGR